MQGYFIAKTRVITKYLILPGLLIAVFLSTANSQEKSVNFAANEPAETRFFAKAENGNSLPEAEIFDESVFESSEDLEISDAEKVNDAFAEDELKKLITDSKHRYFKPPANENLFDTKAVNQTEFEKYLAEEKPKYFNKSETHTDDPAEKLDAIAEERFHWKPALKESFYFLAIKHGFRLLEPKTNRELKGPFFRDWGKSVRNLGGWDDGDSIQVNYLFHPIQGAVTNRIFIHNSDKDKKIEFSNSKEYWASRFKAMTWSAIWSLQFELGPISEASIGNVGLYDEYGPNRMGWVDLVITPAGGLGLTVLEDAIDKFILKDWLENDIGRTKMKLYRIFFNPFRSFSNFLAGRKLWYRENR